MQHERNEKLTELAKKLRKGMTEEERHLWYDYLSKYHIRFRRQEIIGNYIVDFFCERAKLAIELDGSQHYEEAEKEYDAQRTEKLRSIGIDVIRFSNADINRRFEGVCTKIDEAVMFRLSHLSEIVPEWEQA